MPIIIDNCGSQKAGCRSKIGFPYIIIYIGMNGENDKFVKNIKKIVGKVCRNKNNAYLCIRK